MSVQNMPYRDYSHIAMERSDGILEIRLHTDGGPLVFSQSAHRELTDAFAALAADYENSAPRSTVLHVSTPRSRFCRTSCSRAPVPGSRTAHTSSRGSCPVTACM